MKELNQLILEERILTKLDLACVKKIRQYLLSNVIIVYVCF